MMRMIFIKCGEFGFTDLNGRNLGMIVVIGHLPVVSGQMEVVSLHRV